MEEFKELDEDFKNKIIIFAKDLEEIFLIKGAPKYEEFNRRLHFCKVLLQCKIISELDNNFNLPLFVVFLGGNNVGKSSIFNAVLQNNVSLYDSDGGFTKNPLCFVHKSEKERFEKFTSAGFNAIHEFFWPQDKESEELKTLVSRVSNLSLWLLMIHNKSEFLPFIFIDCPDFDSNVLGNEEKALDILSRADIVIFITTQQKGVDEDNFNYLEQLAKLKKKTYILINQCITAAHEEEDFTEKINCKTYKRLEKELNRFKDRTSIEIVTSESEGCILTIMGKTQAQVQKSLILNPLIKTIREIITLSSSKKETLKKENLQHSLLFILNELLPEEGEKGILEEIKKEQEILKEIEGLIEEKFKDHELTYKKTFIKLIKTNHIDKAFLDFYNENAKLRKKFLKSLLKDDYFKFQNKWGIFKTTIKSGIDNTLKKLPKGIRIKSEEEKDNERLEKLKEITQTSLEKIHQEIKQYLEEEENKFYLYGVILNEISKISPIPCKLEEIVKRVNNEIEEEVTLLKKKLSLILENDKTMIKVYMWLLEILRLSATGVAILITGDGLGLSDAVIGPLTDKAVLEAFRKFSQQLNLKEHNQKINALYEKIFKDIIDDAYKNQCLHTLHKYKIYQNLHSLEEQIRKLKSYILQKE